MLGVLQIPAPLSVRMNIGMGGLVWVGHSLRLRSGQACPTRSGIVIAIVSSTTDLEVEGKTKVKGVGQECPSHTDQKCSLHSDMG